MSAAVMTGPAQRGSASNRAFNYALAASLLFHAALLFTFGMQKQARHEPAAPGPIVARLMAPPAAVQAPPSPPQPEPPKPRVEEPPPPVTQPVKPSPVAKPAPPLAPKSVAPAPSVPPQPAPPAPAAEPPPSAAPAPAAPSAPSAVARTEPQPSAPAPSADAGTLETYRMDLMRMARNYKRYPRVALDNNWEGRVVVRMVIGANGMISSISVVNSAGHEVLDKQALDMIQKAKPRVQIPTTLRGREFTLEIPVIYSLKDQDSG